MQVCGYVESLAGWCGDFWEMLEQECCPRKADVIPKLPNLIIPLSVFQRPLLSQTWVWVSVGVWVSNPVLGLQSCRHYLKTVRALLFLDALRCRTAATGSLSVETHRFVKLTHAHISEPPSSQQLWSSHRALVITLWLRLWESYQWWCGLHGRSIKHICHTALQVFKTDRTYVIYSLCFIN